MIHPCPFLTILLSLSAIAGAEKESKHRLRRGRFLYGVPSGKKLDDGTTREDPAAFGEIEREWNRILGSGGMSMDCIPVNGNNKRSKSAVHKGDHRSYRSGKGKGGDYYCPGRSKRSKKEKSHGKKSREKLSSKKSGKGRSSDGYPGKGGGKQGRSSGDYGKGKGYGGVSLSSDSNGSSSRSYHSGSEGYNGNGKGKGGGSEDRTSGKGKAGSSYRFYPSGSEDRSNGKGKGGGVSYYSGRDNSDNRNGKSGKKRSSGNSARGGKLSKKAKRN